MQKMWVCHKTSTLRQCEEALHIGLSDLGKRSIGEIIKRVEIACGQLYRFGEPLSAV